VAFLNILKDIIQMSGTGKYFNGYQPLILPSIFTQRSNIDMLKRGYGFLTVDIFKTGKWLRAPSFGFTELLAAVHYLSFLSLFYTSLDH
jgi:hypothetical protein